MANPDQFLRGRGPLGVGKTYPLDGRWNHTCEFGAVEFLSNQSSKRRHSDAPNTVGWGYTIWFGWAHGRPALYEYEPQYGLWGAKYDEPLVRKRDLTYPPKDKLRAWYEEGDLILPESMTEHKLFERFPELAPSPGEEESIVSTILKGLLLGPAQEYKVVHKVTKLTVAADGDGSIELTPILVLDDKTFVELESKFVSDQKHFTVEFFEARAFGPLIQLMKGYIYVLYEVMMAMGTGGVSSVGRGVGRRAMLFTLKAARRRFVTRMLARKIVTSLKKDATKATLAGLKGFASTFTTVYFENTVQQNLAQKTAAGKKIDRKAYDVALQLAAGAFVSAFVSALLGSAGEKVVKNSEYSDLHKAISKRIIDSFGTNIPKVFIDGIAAAWASETQNPGTFTEKLGKSLVDGLKSTFTSLVSVDFKKIGETLANT